MKILEYKFTFLYFNCNIRKRKGRLAPPPCASWSPLSQSCWPSLQSSTYKLWTKGKNLNFQRTCHPWRFCSFGVFGILGVFWHTWSFVWRIWFLVWCFAWRTWCFLAYIGILRTWYIGQHNWCLCNWDIVLVTFRIWVGLSDVFITKDVHIYVCIPWRNLLKAVFIAFSVEKSTPAGKKYTTVGCGGCD